jgi:5-methylcytosine-specific restriction protein A
MPRASRICNKSGCIEPSTDTYCAEHKLPAWQKRGQTHNIPGWKRIRQHILYRDQHMCQNCGAVATEVDHIKPLSQGGSSKPSNLQALCTPCNKAKNLRERNTPTKAGS